MCWFIIRAIIRIYDGDVYIIYKRNKYITDRKFCAKIVPTNCLKDYLEYRN